MNLKVRMKMHFRIISSKMAQRGFPGSSVVKNPPANAGDMGPIPGLGGSLGEGIATHSSTLAWEIHGQSSLAGYSP